MRYFRYFLFIICVLSFKNYKLYSQIVKQTNIEFPEWISEFSEKDSSNNYALGVSDPGMEKEQAFTQAKIRASAILAMAEGFQYNKMSQSYRSENYERKVVEKNSSIVTINCRFDTTGIAVKNVFFSDIDECYVILSKIADQKHSYEPFVLEASYFTSEGENYAKSHGKMYYKITNDKENVIQFYSRYFLGERLDITSTVNDSIIPFNECKYVYKDIFSDAGALGNNSITEYLGNSFWNAYFTIIMRSLVFHFNSEVQISAKTEDSNWRSQNLNRILVDEYYSLIMSKKIIVDNKLSMAVGIYEIENK